MLINFNNASLHSFANWLADGRCKGPVLELVHGPSCLSYLMSIAAMSKSRLIGPHVPSMLLQRYAWGLRFQANSHRTHSTQAYQSFLSSVHGQHLSLPSSADPTEYIQLVSQDLSGLFTSLPAERFHQALQVLLHRYDQVFGLRNVSHWSVYEVKSDHRRRMFKGKWRRQTKVPRIFAKKICRYSSTLSSTATLRSMATCLEASQWDLRPHLPFVISLPPLRIISGTRP